MKQSHLFTKVRKELPADEVSINAQLLLRAGYIHKEMAGVYAYLPLGWRVMNKVMQVIREEMNVVGGQELFLTSLQDSKKWKDTGRWSDEVIDVWFRTTMANGTEVGLANTHEEAIAQVMINHIHSYKDLPVVAYQFQTKFRNELRAKSGIMRSREFIMKDMYSFSRNKEEHDAFYEKAQQAYINVFERLGIGNVTYFTFASGGSFSQFSHEFQTVSEVGEDTIYIDEEKGIALNKEVYTDEVMEMLGVKKDTLVEKAAVEVGNIFTLGTKYAEALNLSYTDEDGSVNPVFMGSYGIGPGRVMGAIVELLHDDKGIVWPDAIAPFRFHLVNLNKDSVQADSVYDSLQRAGFDVLYDDRSASAGAKLAEADLLGMPYRLVIGSRTGDKVEHTVRKTGKSDLYSVDELISQHA